jgi:hypothetical protein
MADQLCLRFRLPRKSQGSFTCHKSATWDWRLYFPSEGRHAEDFFALKNPTASAGFEPAILGTTGRDSDVVAWLQGQRKMSQVLGIFGVLDFTMLQPVLAWCTFWNLWTIYFFNFPIYFRATVNHGYWISGYGGMTVLWEVFRFILLKLYGWRKSPPVHIGEVGRTSELVCMYWPTLAQIWKNELQINLKGWLLEGND